MSNRSKILVLDDTPEDYAEIKDSPHLSSCDIKFAKNIGDFKDLLTNAVGMPYCVLIIDVTLGRESGFDAISMVKENFSNYADKIITYTWHHDYIQPDIIENLLGRDAPLIGKGNEWIQELIEAIGKICPSATKQTPSAESSSNSFSQNSGSNLRRSLLFEIVHPNKLETMLDGFFQWIKKGGKFVSVQECLYVPIDRKGELGTARGEKGKLWQALDAKGEKIFSNKDIQFVIQGKETKATIKFEGNNSAHLECECWLIPSEKCRASGKINMSMPVGFFAFLVAEHPNNKQIHPSLIDCCRTIDPYLCALSRRSAQCFGWVFGERPDKFLRLGAFLAWAAAIFVFLTSVTLLALTTHKFIKEVRKDYVEVSSYYSGSSSPKVDISVTQEGKQEMQYKGAGVRYIKIVEDYLLTAVFFVAAIALVGLVTDFSPSAPGWIRRFGELDVAKEKIIGIIITILAAAYVEYFLTITVALKNSTDWQSSVGVGIEAVGIGASVSLIVFVLVQYVRLLERKTDHD